MRRVFSTRSPLELLQRAIRRAYISSGAAALEFPLLANDVAGGTQMGWAPGTVPADGRPLRIGWVCTPPGPGSGGHTTMFRMVEALEKAGHECRLFLYDRHGSSGGSHERVVREGWPEVSAPIDDARGGLGGMDAYVATSWDTAHVLATARTVPGGRLYFIQDFEPYFYPRGSDVCPC